jgi:suppressor of tumorigenicity protein 13
MAERDCDLALMENPDSAKALRTRGKARKALAKWEDGLHDLSAAQQIDFDEDTVQDLKELTDKHLEQEKADAAKRNEC